MLRCARPRTTIDRRQQDCDHASAPIAIAAMGKRGAMLVTLSGWTVIS
jgi:hypothetical protein